MYIVSMRDGLSQGCKIAHSIHFFHVVRINLNISDLQWHKFVARSSMCVAGTVVPLQISGEKLEWRMCYHENAFRASTTRQAGNSHHYHIVPAATGGYSSLAPEQAPVLIRFFNHSPLQSFVKQELWQSKKTKHHFDRNVQFIQSFLRWQPPFLLQRCEVVRSFTSFAVFYVGHVRSHCFPFSLKFKKHNNEAEWQKFGIMTLYNEKWRTIFSVFILFVGFGRKFALHWVYPSVWHRWK